MLEFLPGERLKFINVSIVDNPVPELDKIFRVELYSTDDRGENYKSILINESVPWIHVFSSEWCWIVVISIIILQNCFELLCVFFVVISPLLSVSLLSKLLSIYLLSSILLA